MTRRSAWQTAATLLATIALGRWLTGAGFGYTLFVLVWVPTAAACLPLPQSVGRHFGAVSLWAVAASVPWFVDEIPADAVRLALLLAVWTSAVAGLRQCLTMTAGRRILAAERPILADLSPSAMLSVVLWLTWLAAPLTRPDAFVRVLGDRALTVMLGQHPVLVANHNASTAADWTHSAIAYRYLTALGQDVPFDWPGRSFASLAAGATLTAVAWAVIGVRHAVRQSKRGLSGSPTGRT